MPGATRVRPTLHFTVPSGWINDPHAIAWLDGRYHLFYQFNPDAPEWSPHCHWGHATSERLGGWEIHDVALSPDDTDIGIWSGAIAVDGDDVTLLYTAVRGDDWAHGTVAIAHGDPDRRRWTKDPANPVIAGPPADLDHLGFRDPYVWRDDGRWSMIVGTGVRGAGGALVGYSSDDLRRWSEHGLVRVTGADPADFGITAGQLWECPQLFELDGSWILLLSAWEDHMLGDVVYAVGTYARGAFDARRWGRFGRGPAPYATTTFVDADGERAAISWLRERADVQPAGFAGAHSLPVRLRLLDDRLTADLHPDMLERAVSTHAATVVRAHGFTGADDSLRLDAGDAHVLTVRVEAGALSIVATGGDPVIVPIWSTPIGLTVVVDADIVEVFSPALEGFVALRLPAAVGALAVTATGAVTT